VSFGTADQPLAVVDVCALVYDRDCWAAYLGRLGADAPAYLRVFAAAFCRYFSVSAADYLDSLDEHGPAAAVAKLVASVPERVDVASHLAEMETQGVVHEVAHGWPGRLSDGDTINDRVAALADASGGRIQAWAGVSLRDPDEAAAEIRRCQRAGVRGVCAAPFLDGVDAADPARDRIFSVAEELGLPFWIHTGNHFVADRPLDLFDWRHLDRIAGRHPDLTVVAGHGGWPWVRELVTVMRRHRRVYLEFSSHRPRHLGRPGAGWEPLLLYGRGPVRDRVMFGSCTWVQPVPVSVLAREVAELGLGAEVTSDWLAGNAARLLGLPQLVPAQPVRSA